MTQIRSHAFREWESDVNDIHSLFEGNREIAFKKFIQSIKTKTVFNFKPVGPFMERKRSQESTPKNQNQNQDKRPKVASKKIACSMCIVGVKEDVFIKEWNDLTIFESIIMILVFLLI